MNNNIHLTAVRILSAAALALGCGAVMAQAVQTVTLPLETAKLKPSKLAGYQIAMQKCGICHSADYISQQPPAMTATQWTAEVRKMEHAYAAPLSDSDVAQIGEYLAVTYGGAKPTLGPVAVAKPAPAAAARLWTCRPCSRPMPAWVATRCHRRSSGRPTTTSRPNTKATRRPWPNWRPASRAAVQANGGRW
jgi:mono/diheme cytochrome c family protein